jgi:hypothetical protein
MNGFPSPWANMQGHLAVKPGLRPLGLPFLLHRWSEARFAGSLRMKINNAKLLKFFEAIDNNLLGLIMQLLALCKTITARFPAKAQHCPEILRYLSNSVWGQLMKLHPEFE